MRTPVDEGGPHPRPGFGFTQYSTALSSGSADGCGAGSGFGAQIVGAVEGGAPQDPSNPAALQAKARRQDTDVDTRPARRKLYRVDTEEQQRERETARFLQQQLRRPTAPQAVAAHSSSVDTTRQDSQRGDSSEEGGCHQPSRQRSQPSAHAPAAATQHSTPTAATHAHPGERPSSEKRRARRQQQQQHDVPHMDISTYPTASLLHLLAELLTRITGNNDQGGSSSPNGAESAGADAQAPAGGRQARSPPRTPAASGRDRSASTASSAGRGREPVTPAVPFPSPAGAPAGFGSVSDSDAQQQCKGGWREAQAAGYPFPDVDAGESTDDAAGAGAGATRHMEMEEDDDDEVYEPRLNFAAPEHSTYSTITRQHAVSRGDALASPTRRRASEQQRGALFAMMEEDPAAPPRAGRLARSSNAGPSSVAQHQQEYLRDRPTVFTSAANALSIPNATLCFHARNVPSISIESYLVRISKCGWQRLPMDERLWSSRC